MEAGEEVPLSLKHCIARIEAAYDSLGHSRGWRFLTGPRCTFTSGARFAFITLNPAGKDADPAHPRASAEDGSAYWVESWNSGPAGGAVLQHQVQELFSRIARIVGANDSSPRAFVESQVLTAHFIPFRSPSIKDLARRKDSIDFAHALWSDILASWTPDKILTLGNDTFSPLRSILVARLGARLMDHRRSFQPAGAATSPRFQ